MALTTYDRGFRSIEINLQEDIQITVDYDNTNSFPLEILQTNLKSGQTLATLHHAITHIINNNLPADPITRKNVTNFILDVMINCKISDMKNFLDKKAMGDISENFYVKKIDWLMKFVYKGLEVHSNVNVTKILFAWHEMIEEKGGKGCILRVLTDRTEF